MLLGSGGERSDRLWRCCLLSVPLGKQASVRRWDCSGLGNVARKCLGTEWYDGCRGHGVSEMVTSAMRTTADLLGFSNLTSHVQFCHDKRLGKWFYKYFDKFWIIITQRRAQQFGDVGHYKNLVFLFNTLRTKFSCYFSQNLLSYIKDAGTLWVKQVI